MNIKYRLISQKETWSGKEEIFVLSFFFNLFKYAILDK